MTDTALIANFEQVLLILTLVVLAAAALLIGIWWAARRILTLAVAALQQVQRIQGNTQQIWALKTTNDVAGEILDTAAAIERNGAAMVATLNASEDESGVA